MNVFEARWYDFINCIEDITLHAHQLATVFFKSNAFFLTSDKEYTMVNYPVKSLICGNEGLILLDLCNSLDYLINWWRYVCYTCIQHEEFILVSASLFTKIGNRLQTRIQQLWLRRRVIDWLKWLRRVIEESDWGGGWLRRVIEESDWGECLRRRVNGNTW